MAAQNFRVIFTESAWEDIGEVVRYWTDHDEPERGEQYAHDLPTEAIRQLSDPDTARGPSSPPHRLPGDARVAGLQALLPYPLPAKRSRWNRRSAALLARPSRRTIQRMSVRPSSQEMLTDPSCRGFGPGLGCRSWILSSPGAKIHKP